MHWEILIIPLIALGVWIIGTLFKSEDEKTRKSGRRPGNLSARTTGRRPVTDLDRFLEEARRRREVDDRPKPAPAPQPSRALAGRPPLRERPSRPRETPRLAPPMPPAREEVPVVIPAARTTAPPAASEPVAIPMPEFVAPTQPTLAPSRSSPVLQQVRSLLSKPQTAASAFVLREIFDRPLCKRRR